MNHQNRVLIIDAGNTSIKASCFVNGELTTIERFTLNELEKLKKWSQTFNPFKVAISSVISKNDTHTLLNLFDHPLVIDSNSKLPITLRYQSTNTLGIDRICNAVFADKLIQTEFAVIIDIGTCIKFDLINNAHEYLGGSISPGIELRYRSLHDYTGNLPLLSNKTAVDLVGNDTESSIHSGVINGMKAEIQQLINSYEAQYKDLTFFVTGGDARFFDIHSKNDIFADENLTVKGLFEIYKHNA